MDLQRETRPEHSITYAEQIYEILKSQIIQNKIPSGTPLKANLIAEQMQVSISPVRRNFKTGDPRLGPFFRKKQNRHTSQQQGVL